MLGAAALVLFPERECNGCPELRQREWGCDAKELPDGSWDKPTYSPLALSPTDMHYACPRRPIKDDPAGWSELMMLYRMFKLGVLPDEGAANQQAAKGIRTLSYLDGFISKYEAERMQSIARGGSS